MWFYMMHCNMFQNKGETFLSIYLSGIFISIWESYVQWEHVEWIPGEDVALRLGQFNLLCLYLGHVPKWTRQIASSLSCLLTHLHLFRSFVASILDQNASSSVAKEPKKTHETLTASPPDIRCWAGLSIPNSSMALDNLSKSSSLQSPEVWVKKIWSQEGEFQVNQQTLSSYHSQLSPLLFLQAEKGRNASTHNSPKLRLQVSQAQRPGASDTLMLKNPGIRSSDFFHSPFFPNKKGWFFGLHNLHHRMRKKSAINF